MGSVTTGVRRYRGTNDRSANLIMSLNWRTSCAIIDFSPLYRSTIGFDRLFSLLRQVSTAETSAQAYPPYITSSARRECLPHHHCRRGFSEDELTIEAARRR